MTGILPKFYNSLFILFFVLTWNASAQEIASDKSLNRLLDRRGKFFMYFGWNRSRYSKSDIHFHGTGYDFTLKNVVAHDRPTPFNLIRYANPLTMTIPQYQYRIGYYINNKFAISLGFNHMKYVMDSLQTLEINGFIDTPEAGPYNGSYQHQNIKVTKDFLTFEHTNGLNYIDVNFDRTETIWESRQKKISLSAVMGVGAGILYPKSDVRLFGAERDHWHVAGYGFSSHMALRFEFLTNMFIQAQMEGGYINMPDIITTQDIHARADQHFLYFEGTAMIGSYFRLFKKRNRNAN